MAKILEHVPYSHADFWDSMQTAYLGNGKVWNESNNLTPAERWERLIECFPNLKDIRLYEDLTPVYFDAFYTASNADLFTMLDLTLLQWRFMSIIANGNLGLKHVVDYHIVNIYFWQRQLRDKMDYRAYRLEINEIDENGTDLGTPVLEEGEDCDPVVEHTWIH